MPKKNNPIKSIEFNIPKGLLSRLSLYCEKIEVDLDEFVVEAIAEKLEMVHRERRRKPRL